MSKSATLRAESAFGMSAPEGAISQFLATTLRYLLTPRELLSLWRLDDGTIREIGVTREELVVMLAGVPADTE